MTVLRLLLVAIAVMASAITATAVAHEEGGPTVGGFFILAWSVWAMFLVP